MWPARSQMTAPDEDAIANGAKHCCVIDLENRSRTGKVLNDDGDVEWRYEQTPNPLKYSLRNPFNKPDFVVTDLDGQRSVRIRRMSLIPSCYDMLEGDDVVGQISLQSVLLNKYAFTIAGLAPCIFRMPLYTSNFHGEFNHETGVWAVVGPSKRQWNVLIRPEMSDVRLLSALAFVHNQWFYDN